MPLGPLTLRGRLLIATDGLFKYAQPHVLAARALEGDLEDAMTALVDAVRLRTGGLQDDLAVVLCG